VQFRLKPITIGSSRTPNYRLYVRYERLSYIAHENLRQDVSVSSDANTCSATVAAVSINNGSTDPDGDNLTFSVGGETSSIYSVGANPVSLVVSDRTYSGTVTVVDNIVSAFFLYFSFVS
jgi:hypothetical protein